MSPTEPSRKTADGLDMAKLQKSLKQQQRHSRPQIKKLTPSEIRSLNFEATVAKQPSNTSKQKVRSGAKGNSSPTRPNNHGYHRPLPRSSTVPLPNPSGPPVEKDSRDHRYDRRDSHHSRMGRSATANFSHVQGPSSRTSSVSSYRSGKSLQTYRGHEITQSGGHSMLHHPKQEIVTNPLSMFSRPRQSQVHASTSPDKFKRDFMEMDPYQAQAMLNSDSDEADAGDQDEGGMPVSESPTNMDGPEAASKAHVKEPTDSPLEPSTQDVQKRPTIPRGPSSDRTITPANARQANSAGVTAQQQNTQLVEDQQGDPHALEQKPPVEPSVKSAGPSSYVNQTRAAVADASIRDIEKRSQALQPGQSETPPNGNLNKKPESNESRKRFSFHHVFDRKPQDKKESSPQKQRRRTLSFTKTPETSPTPPAAPFTPREVAEPQDGAASEIPTHPAVRPISPEQEAPPSNSSSKLAGLTPLTVPSNPTYGRCACCGRIKKPGYSSELSPVLENENIRSNFSFEADRTSHDGHRKYTPIIPMAVTDKDDTGSIRTVQASIEPKSPEMSVASTSTPRTSTDTRPPNNSSVSVSTAQSAVDSTYREVTMKPNKRHTMDEPKVVRFASLHGRRGSESDVPSVFDEDDAEEEIVKSVPFVQPIKPAPRAVLGPSEQEIQRQRQLHAKAAATASSAAPRAPHPLRQSSALDPQEDDSQSEHSMSLQEAQQQAVKRIPKQDIITVIPIKRQSQSLETSPQESNAPVLSMNEPAPTTNGADGEQVQPSTAVAPEPTPTSSKASSTVAPKKLQKQQTSEYPPSSFPTGHRASRRFSLPQAFRLPNSKRSSTSTTGTFGVPYASSKPGDAPDTDPAHKPALPSQASTARTSFASAVSEQSEGRRKDRSKDEKRNRSSSRDTPLSRIVGGRRSRSASREPVDRIANEANPVINGVALGDANSAGNSSALTNGTDTNGNVNGEAVGAAGAKTVRPSPSFAKFISNLPASHATAKDVPEVKRFFGMRRRSLQQGQQPTIEEDAPAGAPKIELNGNTIVKAGSGQVPQVNSQNEMGTGMTQSLSLPVLKIGEDSQQDYLGGGSRALKGFMEQGDNGQFTASPVEMKTGGVNGIDPGLRGGAIGTSTGSESGFVGGRKLQMLLRGQSS